MRVLHIPRQSNIVLSAHRYAGIPACLIAEKDPWFLLYHSTPRERRWTKVASPGKRSGSGSPGLGHIGEVWGFFIGSNNGLSTFTAVIRARHIGIFPECHEGGYLVEMVAGWGRASSLFPLRLEGSGLGVRHLCSIADSDDADLYVT
jgi:hypothetical protein